MVYKRLFLVGCGAMLLAGIATFATQSFAHHGWSWAEGDNFQLTGVIKSAKLGNPHGLLTVTAKDGDWTVEVGQPWRNARAGLKDEMLAKGVELTIHGNRAKDRKLKVMKAIRIVIKGKNHDLYPERIS